MIHQRTNASTSATSRSGSALTPRSASASAVTASIAINRSRDEGMTSLPFPTKAYRKIERKKYNYKNKNISRGGGSGYLTTLLIYASILVATFWLFSLYTLEQHMHDESIDTGRQRRGDGDRISSKAMLFRNDNFLLKNDSLLDIGDNVNIAMEIDNSNSPGSDIDLDDDPTAFLTMYGKHRFQESFDALPKWLQDYFTWHRLQTTTNRTDARYLVVTCLPKDDCGGLSDRFRTLPFYLFIAKHTKRVLCIHWVKNFGLQEFLRPIPDRAIGIEWRCPAEISRDGMYDLNRGSKMQPNIKMWKFAHCHNMEIPMAPCFEGDLAKAEKLFKGKKYGTVGMVSREPERVNKVNLLVQRHSYGGAPAEDGVYYMPDIYNWQHVEMIGDIFRVMFEPIPSLAKRINATMTNLGLVENEYISTHVRARYPTARLRHFIGNTKFDKDGGLDFQMKSVRSYTINIMRNALECGHMLAPDLKKIFFVSDHNDATRYAITTEFTLGKRRHDKGEGITLRPVGIDRDKEPLHMEGNHSSNAIDYFPVFEDLLIMGGSRCVSHGIGSFGSFGAALGGNKCRAIHRRHTGRTLQCPNEISLPNPVSINATEMIFGEKPGGEGKLTYNKNRYVQLPMPKSDNGKK